ncbi:MAG: Uma2 family endonuclease [Myxococcaceae bacterium]|nr:Uma2 family endonuclease [Myxococcaceae bacterium]MCI0671090.1 Uma2 family endonuclease [Myxococcaceae bacterium]
MSVRKPGQPPARYEDLLALPEHITGQIVAGELFATPRPAFDHGLAASSLLGELAAPFGRGRGGPGGWWLIVEPELHLGQDILVPDLGGWRRERMPELPGAFATVAPDWVCEVLSPSTAGLDRVRKLPIYAREGVSHAWVIDPQSRTLEVFRLAGGSWVLSGSYFGDQTVRAQPFESIELELGALWPPSGADGQ